MSCMDVRKGVKCAVVYGRGLNACPCAIGRLTSADIAIALTFNLSRNSIIKHNRRGVAGALMDFNR
jgi:hypothetical protein